MSRRIALINPPIYDFAAYDFWLKPYGLLTVAGYLQNHFNLQFFDYLDRLSPLVNCGKKLRSDAFGRGEFCSQQIDKPEVFAAIPRRYRRFGLPRKQFQDWLSYQKPFYFVLIQTSLTYWYPGIKEVVDDIANHSPAAKIVLGGIYATLCPAHAANLGAHLIIKGNNLEPLWKMLDVRPQLNQPPFWQGYQKNNVGVLKLTDGCPFNCTYCASKIFASYFTPKPLDRVITELEALLKCGVANIAFYDDALLFDAERILKPFLKYVIEQNITVNFHTPNALHARFITPPLAEMMVSAGFKTFYLGFENASSDWHRQTGSKVSMDEIAAAVKNLTAAGADKKNITAYIIIGHPLTDTKDVELSMLKANQLGIKIMLAEFSPIPNTPDGDLCGKYVDLTEPLWHNKIAFPIVLLGDEKVNRLKDLCRHLNQK